MQALDYESNSNLLIQTKIANQYLKKEKEVMGALIDQMIQLKADTDELYNDDTERLIVPPELEKSK